MNSDELRSQLEDLHLTCYGWALHCCSRDPIMAEDVLQTVYLKILEGKAQYNARSAFQTWVFAVIKKTASDERRRRWLRRLVIYEDESISLTTDQDPEEQVEQSEKRSFFQEALARLSTRQREVLQLVFYHNLTINDAAAVMGVSLGSARTHYERGKKNLRQLIEHLEVSP